MTKQSFYRISAYGSDSVSSIQKNAVLYTAQENATIRRIIVHVAANNNNSTVAECFFRLTVAPNGNNVVDLLQSGQTLVANEEMPYEYIAGGVLTSGNLLTIDTKGMRKLRQGDQIHLNWIEGTTTTSTDDLRFYADIFMSQ